MKELEKLKKVDGSHLYNLLFRTFLGMALAYYFSVIIEHTFATQVAYFFIIALASVVIEYLYQRPFKKQIAVIENQKLTLFGIQYDAEQTEKIEYFQANDRTHLLRIKLKDHHDQDIELTTLDCLDDMRLFKFINEHFMPINLVDELKQR